MTSSWHSLASINLTAWLHKSASEQVSCFNSIRQFSSVSQPVGLNFIDAMILLRAVFLWLCVNYFLVGHFFSPALTIISGLFYFRLEAPSRLFRNAWFASYRKAFFVLLRWPVVAVFPWMRWVIAPTAEVLKLLLRKCSLWVVDLRNKRNPSILCEGGHPIHFQPFRFPILGTL